MKKYKYVPAFALILSMLLTACSPDGNSADTTSTQTTDAPSELSVPVVTDEDGEVDMEVALAYKTDVEALKAELAAKPVNADDTVSENTNAKTKKVFDYLRSNWGVNVLTGQEMSSSDQREDLLYYSLTEDLPAIKGFDMIGITGPSSGTDEVDKAIEWHTKSNGLVSFCWHWKVPCDIDDLSKGYAFYSDEISNFSLANAVTEGTKEYETVIHDIDTLAIQFQRLEAADVPVLFRPLHEASGSWFWWGSTGREGIEGGYYEKLWYMIYDRLENYHKLTNIIWIWNGQTKSLCVSPNTYDISGIDVYPQSETHSPMVSSYEKLSGFTEEGKMLALTECGYIPDITEVIEGGYKWLYYMPWYGDFVFVNDGSDTPKVNTEKMSEEFFLSVLNNEHTITWKDLPDWGGTTREVPSHILVWQFYTQN